MVNRETATMRMRWPLPDELTRRVALRVPDAERREEGVVAAHAHVRARVELGATLANQDGAAGDDFPGEPLDAEALRVGVAPVFSRA